MTTQTTKKINKKRGGGQNRKSLEEHLRDGTYQRSRHGPINDGLFDFPEKPPAEVRASALSQRRYLQNAADEHALNSGCRFNERLADHACDFFAQQLCHSKGEWAGKPFELSGWHRDDVIRPLFGWVRRNEKGQWVRRFSQTYIECPKKTGKSTLASGIGLYMEAADGQAGAEIYSFGADKEQAKVVHSEAINMVNSSPRLKIALKVNKTTSSINYEGRMATYQAKAAVERGLAGKNIHCAICDELHEWYGDVVWDQIVYGFRARRGALLFVITNAGDDMQSVCYKQHEKARNIINGTLYDDRYFAIIASASKEDADGEIAAVREGATELPVARACTPAIGEITLEEDLLRDVQNAIQTPSELPNLMRLTYGIWEVSSEPWLNADQWAKCGREFTETDLLGRPCWAGVDLSQTKDMTSVALVFPEDDGTFKQLVYFWLPSETIHREKKVLDYRQWVEQGWLRSIPGKVIEESWVEEFLVEAAEKYDLQSVIYDKMYATGLSQRLYNDHAIDVIEFPQTITYFAGATAIYERLILAEQLHHNNNKVLTWQAEHVQVKPDVNNNKRPVKPPSGDHRKIDGIVAGIMGLWRANEDADLLEDASELLGFL